jgi:hypothetical protein
MIGGYGGSPNDPYTFSWRLNEDLSSRELFAQRDLSTCADGFDQLAVSCCVGHCAFLKVYAFMLQDMF